MFEIKFSHDRDIFKIEDGWWDKGISEIKKGSADRNYKYDIVQCCVFYYELWSTHDIIKKRGKATKKIYTKNYGRKLWWQLRVCKLYTWK